MERSPHPLNRRFMGLLEAAVFVGYSKKALLQLERLGNDAVAQPIGAP
jgi:hypothetical protein